MEPLIAPDVETDLIGALTPALPEAHVSDRVPQARPVQYVRVNRIGGADSMVVQERPLVMVECWAADAITASALARTAAAHMRAMPGSWVGGSWVYEVQLTSPVNQPDPQTSDFRYTFTAQMRVRLKELS